MCVSVCAMSVCVCVCVCVCPCACPCVCVYLGVYSTLIRSRINRPFISQSLCQHYSRTESRIVLKQTIKRQSPLTEETK